MVTIGPTHPLDRTDLAQPAMLVGKTNRRELLKPRQQVGAPDIGDVYPRVLRGGRLGVVGGIEQVDPLDGLAVNGTRLCATAERADPGGEIVQCREMHQRAAVAAEQYLPQIDQAVVALLARCAAPSRWAVPVLHLSVVLEKAHMVGRELDARQDAELVVHSDRVLAEAVLDAGALDPGCQRIAKLPHQLRGDPAAKKYTGLLGLHARHLFAGELFGKRLSLPGGAVHLPRVALSSRNTGMSGESTASLIGCRCRRHKPVPAAPCEARPASALQQARK
jgi:hypothetical protein